MSGDRDKLLDQLQLTAIKAAILTNTIAIKEVTQVCRTMAVAHLEAMSGDSYKALELHKEAAETLRKLNDELLKVEGFLDRLDHAGE